MPAASQVMKGLLLVATDTSITAPPSVDGESITQSTRHSVSLTLACIIKAYSLDLPALLGSFLQPPPPQKKKMNMKERTSTFQTPEWAQANMAAGRGVLHPERGGEGSGRSHKQVTNKSQTSQ
ncbi:uncharacterized protein V6R79_008495 [Siganus canaliculatus]